MFENKAPAVLLLHPTPLRNKLEPELRFSHRPGSQDQGEGEGSSRFGRYDRGARLLELSASDTKQGCETVSLMFFYVERVVPMSLALAGYDAALTTRALPRRLAPQARRRPVCAHVPGALSCEAISVR